MITNEMAKSLAEKVWPENSSVRYNDGEYEVGFWVVSEWIGARGLGSSWEEAFENAGVKILGEDKLLTGKMMSEGWMVWDGVVYTIVKEARNV
jgi:hypothetical protein